MTVNLTATVGSDAATELASFTSSAGRRSKTDTYPALTATLTILSDGLPGTWALGSAVVVRIDDFIVCQGYITNIDYNYDFIEDADTYTVSLEGYLSFFGRSVLTDFTMSNQLVGTTLNNIAAAVSGTGKTISAPGTRSYVDTSTYSGAAQNLITALVSMEQGRIDDTRGLKVFGRNYYSTDWNDAPPYFPTFYFADDGTADYYKYDNITFSSLSNNYFDFIQVEPELFATQTAGTGNRALSITTYDTSAAQADNLADYCLAEFDQSTSAPVEISATTSTGLNALFWEFFQTFRIGMKAEIIFRGTTYYSITEGYTLSANPSEVRCTLFMSGFEQNNFMLLDDPVYGTLDYNNLNF